MPTREQLREKVKSLTPTPGVYIMKNAAGKIIYVGKSKCLRNRVASYFQPPKSLSFKTAKLSEQIHDFECIFTKTENEALLLENELIKRHRPRYNIKLKDSKSYPYLKIDYSKPYPKLVITRRHREDNAKYFGPYSSSGAVWENMETIQKNFKIATCGKDFVYGKQICRPCLNSHIGQCIAPCTGKITPEEYRSIFAGIEMCLKGDYEAVLQSLEREMTAAAEQYRFEEAARCRDKIAALKNLTEKQKILFSPENEQDVFGLFEGETMSVLAVLFVRRGIVIDKEVVVFSADELSDNEVLYDLIQRYYDKRVYIPKCVITSFDLGGELEKDMSEFLSERGGKKVLFYHPYKGDKKALCDMAKTNAEETAKVRASIHEHDAKILFQLAEMLRLECFPTRIEAYDISNNGDRDMYAGMIVLTNGRFAKSDYRSFSIHSVDGTDDYAAMTEALTRRLSYLVPLQPHGAETGSGTPDAGASDTDVQSKKKENPSFETEPDLILLDGGKGHVSAAKDVLQKLSLEIPVFGMVKDSYHKTRTLTDGENEISIAKEQAVFSFIYRIQEEVHRFTFSKMDASRRKTVKRSVLENIDGIGPAKAKLLLSHFKTLKQLKEADMDALCEVKGVTRELAQKILDYFQAHS